MSTVSGVNMKSLYIAADDRHSFGLFETDSAAAIAEIAYAFGGYMETQVFPSCRLRKPQLSSARRRPGWIKPNGPKASAGLHALIHMARRQEAPLGLIHTLPMGNNRALRLSS